MAGNDDAYRGLARIYDPVTAPFLDPARRTLRDLVAGAGARRVLDLCCGTGRQCLFFREKGLASVGADLSPAMLAAARRLLGPAFPLVRLDAARPAFAPGAFDAATLAFALHEKEEVVRLAILDGAFAMVRPGGLVVVADYAPPAGLGPGRLAVLAAERSAGRTHWRNYRHFMQNGASPGLFARAGRRFAFRTKLLWGEAAVYAAEV